MLILQEETLNITEIFSSVQGETRFTGLPTTFVRTAACNLRCRWCDTPYSFGRGTTMSLSSILSIVEENGHSHVCVTGGEPLLHLNSHLLMRELCDRGYVVSLETGGSLSIADVDPRVSSIVDVKCPGSGMEEKNDWNNLNILRPHDEVKFVILDRPDYDYSKKVIEKYNLMKRIHPVLFSPVHGSLDPKDLVRWILEDRLFARLNLQIHKYIWGAATKGV